MTPVVPKISIITPSYNQGIFLEDTIRSVLGQGYPNLEYIVMDGGSSDNSVEIIRKFEADITHWESKKDGGQAQAINKGLSMATGDIVGWLNSDDMHMPGTLKFVAHFFRDYSFKRPAILFGNCIHLREKKPKVYGSNVCLWHEKSNLDFWDYIIQPSSFWTKATVDTVGPLHEHLTYAFDWEWFIRAKNKGVSIHPVDRFLSIYRLHESHKTGTGGEDRVNELASIYETFQSRQIADAYRKYRLDGKVHTTRKLLKKMGVERFVDPVRVLYYLHFRSQVSWQEFADFSQQM